MKIKKVEPSDEGVYACIAYNSFGKIKQEIRLVVRGKRKRLTSTPFTNFEIARDYCLTKVFRKQGKL